MDEATKLLIELRQTVRCTHLDMGGKNRYMLTIHSQPIIKKINEYLCKVEQEHIEDKPCCEKPRLSYGLTVDQWICGNCGARSRDQE